MKNIYIVFVGIFLISCNVGTNKSANQLWEEAQQHRVKENLKDSITGYKEIISRYPDHDLSAKAQFQIADIYLNDTKDFEYAVNEFKKVVDRHANHEVAKKSLFMIAYIYNNYLDAYSDAIIYYNLFKEKYPDDELIPSVRYELDGLKVIKSTIDSLNSTINIKSNV